MQQDIARRQTPDRLAAGSHAAGHIGKSPVAVPRGLLPTPFTPRLQALTTAHQWMWWAGHLSPAVLDNVEAEYFAIRNQATLFDISPMHKYRITGPDTARVIDRLVTRSIAKVHHGTVAYSVWCDEDGMVIDDGTLFRFAENDFRICCQEPQFGWLHDIAWGFDVNIRDETEDFAGLALQGPTSFSVLQSAGLADAATLKPFQMREIEPGLMISRTGFTGDLGYELWCAPDAALGLWDRLWQAGAPPHGNWGLRAIGYDALNMARVEAGFIVIGIDCVSIHRAQRPSRGRTPYELGLGHLVHLDKPHFNGRRALVAWQEKGARTQLVGLDIAGAKPAHGALVYFRGKVEAGHVTSAVWSPTAKRNIALAEIRGTFLTEKKRNDLSVEIYTNKEGKWERTMPHATLTQRPFLRLPRARLTPPAPF